VASVSIAGPAARFDEPAVARLSRLLVTNLTGISHALQGHG
jgi:DNA-binding IclR family transcriptional regulator